MGQVTIYIDDETERRMRDAAEAAHLSNSKWVARLIRTHISSQWPEDVAALAGVWKDFPSADELRAKPGVDVPREEL